MLNDARKEFTDWDLCAFNALMRYTFFIIVGYKNGFSVVRPGRRECCQ